MKSKTCNRVSRLALILLIGLLTHNISAQAQDAVDEAEKTAKDAAQSAYALNIEGCDFTISLPSKPTKTTRCKNPKTQGMQRRAKNECYDVYSHVQTFTGEKEDDITTLSTDVFCRPSTDIMYAYYNKDMMAQTLRAMVKVKSMFNHIVGYNNDNPEVKTASLTHEETKSGKNNTLTAQIWVSKKAFFSMETTLAGDESLEADIAFNHILNSIAHTKP